MADEQPVVDPPGDDGEPDAPDDPALDEPTAQADGSPDAPDAADPPDDPADEEPPPEAPDDDDENDAPVPPAPAAPEAAPEAPAAAAAPEPAPLEVIPAPPAPEVVPDPVPVPVQRTFTTPAGQSVTVIEHPEGTASIEEVKAAPVVEQVKPTTAEEAPAIVVTAPAAAGQPAQSTVVTTPATIVTAPAAVVEQPAPAPVTHHDPPPKPTAIESLTHAVVPDKIVYTHAALNDPKPNPVGVSAILTHPIGIFKQYIAGADKSMTLQQHVYSISGDDFTVLDEAKKKVFRTWDKTLSASGKMHMVDSVSSASITNLRKKLFRMLSCWYTDAPGLNKVEIKSAMSMGTRTLKIHFLNFLDNRPVDLYLKGHFGESKGALLHLGGNAKGPVVARIERDVMNARQILHGKQTYRLHVMKNFDMALASLICIAFEDRSCSTLTSAASTLILKK